jgi:hypothetical protein
MQRNRVRNNGAGDGKKDGASLYRDRLQSVTFPLGGRIFETLSFVRLKMEYPPEFVLLPAIKILTGLMKHPFIPGTGASLPVACSADAGKTAACHLITGKERAV